MLVRLGGSRSILEVVKGGLRLFCIVLRRTGDAEACWGGIDTQNDAWNLTRLQPGAMGGTRFCPATNGFGA